MLIYSQRRLRQNKNKKDFKRLNNAIVPTSATVSTSKETVRRNIPDRSADTEEPFIQSLLVLHITLKGQMNVGQEAALLHLRHIQSHSSSNFKRNCDNRATIVFICGHVSPEKLVNVLNQDSQEGFLHDSGRVTDESSCLSLQIKLLLIRDEGGASSGLSAPHLT